MERIWTVVVEKILDCVREYNVLSSLDYLVYGGQDKGFWKVVKEFEKTQKQVKIIAKKLIIELPKNFTKKSLGDLKLLANEILSFVTLDFIAPYFTWWIRTAKNDASNLHMIIIISERTRSSEYVLNRNDVYYNYNTCKISNSSDLEATLIVKKGEIKVDQDGYPIQNNKPFGIKLETLKTKKYLFSLREKLADLFNSLGEQYIAHLKKEMIPCSRFKSIKAPKQKEAVYNLYVLIQTVKKKATYLEVQMISSKFKKLTNFSDKVIYLTKINCLISEFRMK